MNPSQSIQPYSPFFVCPYPIPGVSPSHNVPTARGILLRRRISCPFGESCIIADRSGDRLVVTTLTNGLIVRWMAHCFLFTDTTLRENPKSSQTCSPRIHWCFDEGDRRCVRYRRCTVTLSCAPSGWSIVAAGGNVSNGKDCGHAKLTVFTR